MPRPTFQRSTTNRVLTAAPELRFVAFYHSNEERLKDCMNDYEHRSFVYVLTKDYNGTEHYIYAGKSKAQYARLLMHLRKFAFDHLYLFECEPKQLTKCEAAVIQELTPLYNVQHNPMAERNRQLLGIDYDSQKDAKTIHHHLEQKLRYEATCLYGFALPGPVFSVLEQQAEQHHCTCSELLQRILESTYPQEIAKRISQYGQPQTNLISSQAYGLNNGKSQEQIKVYCRNNRLSGAVRIGRDWILPKDTRFPEDHRRRGSK